MYSIYARINEDKKVIGIFSNYFNEPNSTDVFIDSGEGDKFVHVQGVYRLFDSNGCHNYKIEEGKFVKCTDEEKRQEYNELNKFDVCSAKEQKIQQSKELLARWLINNPLVSSVHDGVEATYTVTEEKQSLLTQNLLIAQLKQSSITTWNCQGGVCEEWKVEELSQLALEIESYVKPRIKKQQTYEVQINKCTTVEGVNNIEIEYDTI